MLSYSSIVIGSVVNFSMYAESILGSGYKGATVLAILDAGSASDYINPATIHASIYPILPKGTPNNYKDYLYLKIRTNSGQVTAVGLPWIDDSTYAVQQAAKMTIVLDSVDPSDQANVAAALSALGFTDAAISISLSSPSS